MRRRVMVLGVAGVAMSATARADVREDTGYPQITVDRPLVLLPGMTSVDLGIDFPTYSTGLSSYTPLGRFKMLDLVARHAFGQVELVARFVDSVIGPDAILGGAVMLGPGALGMSASVRLPTQASGLDHEYGEALGYSLKAIVVPHMLSVSAGATVSADQYAGMYPSTATAVSGDPIGASGGVAATVQLLDEFSVSIDGGIEVPLFDTGTASTAAYAGTTATYVVDRFDIYGFISVGNLPHRPPHPYAGIGVNMRFGGR